MNDERSEDSSAKRIKAVVNMFDIVESMLELEGSSIREIAAEIDVPKSTAHIYLKTLEEAGYVVKRDGTYRLGHRFLNIGGRVRHQSSVYQAARNKVDELARQSGKVATIGIEENGYRVMLYRTEPTGGVFNNAPTGEYTQMHWTALGKALLSQKSREEVDSIVDQHGLPRATEKTITDKEDLFDELETVHERKYSVEDEERVDGVKSIAVPIEGENEVADVAISVAGPKHELNPDYVESDLLPQLRNTANVIELKTRHY